MAEIQFFVYGSLTQGLVHFERIREFVLAVRPGEFLGTAYRLKMGFPVIAEEGHDVVPGELVTVKNSAILVELLDRFHGFHQTDLAQSLHLRKQIRVRTPEGETSAWAYVINPAHLPKEAIKIENGDWLQALKQQPPLFEKLTEKQKNYILRLGKCTGREVVPVDLPLYRELMNLELIVDKGRRLALSKLGHELFRHLNW